MTDPDTQYGLIFKQSEIVGLKLANTLRRRMKPISKEAREIVEAVVGGAKIHDGFYCGSDCWSVIKPSPVTNPCSNCGGCGYTSIGCKCPTCHGTGKEGDQ